MIRKAKERDLPEMYRELAQLKRQVEELKKGLAE